jgi:hypothetical protein
VIKKILTAVAAAVLSMGALECASGAPQSQCQDGSSRTRTSHHRAVKEECHNGEWVKQE